MRIVDPRCFHRLLVAAFLVLLVTAPAAAQRGGVRDSGGVVVIEHPRAGTAAPVAFQLETRPVVQIGSDAGGPELQFNRISGVVRLSSGSIAVADRGSGEIRVFAQDARFLRRVGRRGQGPGEFRTLAHIRSLPADSLIAIDGIGGRLTVFDPDGKVARTFAATGEPREGAPSSLPAPPMTVLPGSFADGSFLAYRRASPPSGDARTLVRDTLVVRLFSRDGAPVGDIGRFLGGELQRSRTMTTSGGTITSYSVRSQAVVFGREPFFAIGTDVVYAGDGMTYEVRAYDRTGRLRRIIRVDEPIRPVTPSMVTAYYAAVADAAGRPRPTAAAITGPDAPPAAATLPAYGALRVDAASRLWIKDYPMPGDTVSKWVVFDFDGSRIGVVVMSASFDPMHLGVDVVAGVWRDDLGVESVRVYRLLSPRGRSPAPRQ